jgi:hypothetical protein
MSPFSPLSRCKRDITLPVRRKVVNGMTTSARSSAWASLILGSAIPPPPRGTGGPVSWRRCLDTASRAGWPSGPEGRDGLRTLSPETGTMPSAYPGVRQFCTFERTGPLKLAGPQGSDRACTHTDRVSSTVADMPVHCSYLKIAGTSVGTDLPVNTLETSNLRAG